MMIPTIHLNGTSREALVEQVTDACAAVRDAISVLYLASPNGRDYYPQGPTALQQAAEEHRSRVERLGSVLQELEELAEGIVGVGR